ncbi:conserved oligomeric Golgi complex subunit 3 [Platysternon megacephalum]|uniref:Conserved oligomeric Golgi complex subunit 3 n=1 Tax=Platysternon megacephalum TaxID=55544 RepID=A0A4D9EZA6_9SAUR|nr:conserved oligomeric Golgi complex subunit 3 [Platysternon megacephalum]
MPCRVAATAFQLICSFSPLLIGIDRLLLQEWKYLSFGRWFISSSRNQVDTICSRRQTYFHLQRMIENEASEVEMHPSPSTWIQIQIQIFLEFRVFELTVLVSDHPKKDLLKKGAQVCFAYINATIPYGNHSQAEVILLLQKTAFYIQLMFMERMIFFKQ